MRFASCVRVAVISASKPLRHLKNISNMSSKEGHTQYAAVSCDDSEKWGYSEATINRLFDIHRQDGEQWTAFHAARGQVPTIEDLKKYKGIIISGSPKSVHDDIDWIVRLQEFIQNAASLQEGDDETSPKIIGVCFGHQLIAKALGGKVELNPDKDFVLQTEEIRAVEGQKDSKLVKDLFKSGPLRVVECHSECVTEIPKGAVTLGTSVSCKHEVVQYSKNILGVQSHPEMLPEEAERLVLPAIKY
ncbi:putative glutamine amidotransferase [Exaiptasia diaphana]|nr:putative glutamine amidotransferase [Exaiptasia diaphana]